MQHGPPPPPPPLPPPLSENAKKMFAKLADEQAAQALAAAQPYVFTPLSLKGRTPSYPKSKQHLPQSGPRVDLSHVLDRHVVHKGKGSKGLKGIEKDHLLLDKPLEYARDMLRQVYHHPVGTTRTVEASAAAPLDDPLTIHFTKKKGGKKSHKRSHKKGGKKSHKKRTHRRRH